MEANRRVLRRPVEMKYMPDIDEHFVSAIDEAKKFYKSNESHLFSIDMVSWLNDLETRMLGEILVEYKPNVNDFVVSVNYQESRVNTYLEFYNGKDYLSYKSTKYLDEDSDEEITTLEKRVLTIDDEKVEIEEQYCNDDPQDWVIGRDTTHYFDEVSKYEHREEKIVLWKLMQCFHELVHALNRGECKASNIVYDVERIRLQNYFDLINIQYQQMVNIENHYELLVPVTLSALKALDVMLNNHDRIVINNREEVFEIEPNKGYKTISTDTEYLMEDKDIRVIIFDNCNMFSVWYVGVMFDVTIDDNVHLTLPGSNKVYVLPVGSVGMSFIKDYYQALKRIIFRITTGFDPISNEY